MNFDWRMSVGIISGVGAKELVVSTLAVMYSGEEAAEDVEESTGLAEALRQQMTPATALAFLVFVLLYTPCMAAVATMRRELSSRKWTAFAVVYQIGIAYVAALLTYFIGSFFVG